MQEFTRIIGSIQCTGILSANCFIFRKIKEGAIKEKDKGE